METVAQSTQTWDRLYTYDEIELEGSNNQGEKSAGAIGGPPAGGGAQIDQSSVDEQSGKLVALGRSQRAGSEKAMVISVVGP